MYKPFRRKGSESNTQVGRDFEAKAQNFFAQRGLHLTPGVALEIGINGRRLHSFDLGDEQKYGSSRFRPCRWLILLLMFSNINRIQVQGTCTP
jgi:hypothetical protein